MLRVIEDLAGDWRRLDECIENLSDEIAALVRQDKGCERLMTVPGIGPIISSAMVAAIGGGDAFSKGCDFGAWLGLVPKQMSTGDRTILGSISRRGNRYLRTLFVQAAWVALVKTVGPIWPHIVDRGSQTTAAPQRVGDARQQARSHPLGGSPQGTRFRVRQEQCNSVPICLILAPCSDPSRRGLETLAQVASLSRRPALTAPCARRVCAPAGRDEGTAPGANKGTVRSKEIVDELD